MKLFNHYFIIIIFSFFGLSACSPHPSTGVWESTDNNELGVTKIIIAFEGKAGFTSTKPSKVEWHCFWGKENDESLNLDCSPSISTERPRKFVIVSRAENSAELQENGKLLIKLKRINENPVLTK